LPPPPVLFPSRFPGLVTFTFSRRRARLRLPARPHRCAVFFRSIGPLNRQSAGNDSSFSFFLHETKTDSGAGNFRSPPASSFFHGTRNSLIGLQHPRIVRLPSGSASGRLSFGRFFNICPRPPILVLFPPSHGRLALAGKRQRQSFPLIIRWSPSSQTSTARSGGGWTAPFPRHVTYPATRCTKMETDQQRPSRP